MAPLKIKSTMYTYSRKLSFGVQEKKNNEIFLKKTVFFLFRFFVKNMVILLEEL